MMKHEIVTVPNVGTIQQTNATTDYQVLDMFLQLRSPGTRPVYAAAIECFFEHAGYVGIGGVKVDHIVAYMQMLGESGLSQATIRLRLNALKSLLTFAHTIGYTPCNVGSVVKAAAAPHGLANRILSEDDVRLLRHTAQNMTPRDALLIDLLYYTGARVSEIVELRWCNVVRTGDGGQVNLLGKGNKERSVLLSPKFYSFLDSVRGDSEDEPVFVGVRSEKKTDRTRIWRDVKKIAMAAGLPDVSPHWLRHAHASHSLERGATLVLVKETLGHANVQTTNAYLHARPGDSSGLYLA